MLARVKLVGVTRSVMVRVRKDFTGGTGLAAILMLAWVLLVAAATAASRTGLLPIGAVASSPEKLAGGRVWMLISSSLVLQQPLGLSLLSLVALATLVLVLCGARLLWLTALVGHVGSTLCAYSLLAVTRLVEPDRFGPLLTAPDYGVSAIEAAWLGAVAVVAWRRRGSTFSGRLAIVLCCLAIATFAWMLRGHPNILDSDHVFAFAIGISLSTRGALGRSSLRRWATRSTAASARG